MKMHAFRVTLRALAFVAAFIACAPAYAQWQTTTHSVPIGKGGSITGFNKALPGMAGNVFTSNGPSVDPSFQPPAPPSGPIAVSSGGTGTTNLNLYSQGMGPAKLASGVISINPGTVADAAGVQLYTSTQVLTADVTVATINPAANPCIGSSTSGPQTLTGTTNGVGLFLYLVKRNSDSKLCLVADSSDVYDDSFAVSITGGGSTAFSTGGPASGLIDKQTVYFTVTGPGSPTLPAPLGLGQRYYVVNPGSHFASGFTISTQASGGSSLPISGTVCGGCVVTLHHGVQTDLDQVMGVGTYTVLRGLRFGFVWNYSSAIGIPDFQNVPADNMAYTWLTDPGGPYQILSAGTTGGATTTLDLRPWLNNVNRNITVAVACTTTGSAGTAFIGAVAANRPVCEGDPGVTQYGMFNVQTDSDSGMVYKTTAGTRLTMGLMGWGFVDPR